ncbi:MAG: HU family DNA-binding protein [Pseudomonadota bacterium]
MNKQDLIDHVADTASIKKTEAAAAVDAVLDGISSSLKSGNEVRLTGFGNFVVNERAASTGRNPRTGDTVQIPAAKVPKFKPGKTLKDAVNGG